MSAVLKALYEKQDEIPEAFRPLFSERGGKFELTGIEGVKTQGDVDRLSTSLTKERADHKTTKGLLEAWGDLKPDEVRVKLDQYPQLELAAAGKVKELDDAQRKALTAPLERQIDNFKKQVETLTATVTEFKGRERTRNIHDAVRAAAVESKVQATALEDVLLLAERVFDVDADGKVTVKDNAGFTPGLDAKLWLQDMQAKRPHWWPPSQGGGGTGGGGGGFPDNPWLKANWNVTKQGQLMAQDPAKAKQMAQSAGLADPNAAAPVK
jgi:hypothetical protein